jgi:dTMP kinase
MKDGILITFEGIEGSGKTTQLKILADYLQLHKRPCLVTREPGGTQIGDAIRKLLLNPANAAMVPLAELLLYVAQRAQHVKETLEPALGAGKIILCDRYCDATTAYQGGARRLPSAVIDQLNHLATGGMMPRLTFLLDCPVELGLRRARDRFHAKEGRPGGDRIEREELDFHERVREAYLAIARREPQRVVIVDGTADIDTIQQKILRELDRVL